MRPDHLTGPARTASPERTGRGLVAAIALIGATTGLLVALGDAATEGDGLTRIDAPIARHVVSIRTSQLTWLAHLLTFAGSEVVVASAALLAMVALLRRRHLTSIAAVAIGMAGAAVLTVGLKLAVGRARPGARYRLGDADNSQSFPSGHTLTSAVLLSLLVIVVVPLTRRPAARIVARSAAVLLAAGVGLSRVYLGYHWTTDVLAAWLVAAAWVKTVWLLLAFVRTRERSQVAVRFRPQ